MPLLWLLITHSLAFNAAFSFSSNKPAEICDGVDCKTITEEAFKAETLDCSDNFDGTSFFDDVTFELSIPPHAVITAQTITLNVSTITDLYSPPTKFSLLFNNFPIEYNLINDKWNDECESCIVKKSFILRSGLTNMTPFRNGTNSLRLKGLVNKVCVSGISLNIIYRVLFPIVLKLSPSLGPITGGTNITVSTKIMYPEYNYNCCFGEQCTPFIKENPESEKGYCLTPEGSGSVLMRMKFQGMESVDEPIIENEVFFSYYNLTLKGAKLTESNGKYYLAVSCDGLVSTENVECRLNEDRVLIGRIQNSNYIVCMFEDDFDIDKEDGHKYNVSVSLNNKDFSTDSVELVIKRPQEGKSQGYIIIIVLVVCALIIVVIVVVFLVIIKKKKKVVEGEYINPDDVVLEDMLGNGSYGDVYSAMWRGQEIAVKLIPTKNMLQDSVLQFTREVQVMRKLRHPCVLQFFGSGTDANFILIAMEYMARGSAHALLMNKNLPMSWGRRLHMLKDAASGMFYLHSCSPPIIHLDLKSHNLLVDENWKVKVSDFGLSMTSLEGSAHSNTVCGTLPWTAPEMLKGLAVTTKADVYSYAIVMWEFLSRAEPYPNIPRYHLIEKVGEIGIRPDIPQNNHIAFCELMQKCWEKYPEDRPDFSEIIVYLNDFIREEDEKNALVSNDEELYE